MQTEHKTKLKRGTRREDGLLFVKYHSNGSEYWMNDFEFAAMIENERKNRLRRKAELSVYESNYRSANREKINRDHALWRKKNAGKVAAVRAMQRARKKGATPIGDGAHEAKAIYETAKRISNCLGVEHHVDHIVPLAKGGAHHISNLRVLPAKWNLRKSDKLSFKLPACYETRAFGIDEDKTTVTAFGRGE